MKKKSLIVFVLFLFILNVKANTNPQWITSVDNVNAVNSWLCFRKCIL